jgi:nuclear RNA export factor
MAFSNVTGLVLPATLSVLGENAWDGDAAFAKLMEVKVRIFVFC